MHPADRTEDFRKYLFLKSKRLNKNVIGKKCNRKKIKWCANNVNNVF